MRTRMTVLIVAILLASGLVALNWPEFIRPSPVSLGFTIVDAPLPLILLGTLIIALVAALANAAWSNARHDLTLARHIRELQAQRELADKAEASRFTELRLHLDNQAREARQREAVVTEALQATLLKGQRDMQAQVEQMSSRLAAQMGTIEAQRAAELPH